MRLGLHLGMAPTGGASQQSSYLDSVLDNAVMDNDAVIGYTSGQTWANLLGNTAYDFYLGTGSGSDAADPTFSTDHFTLDGGDYFTPAGSPTGLLQMHRDDGTGSLWTFVIAVRTPSAFGGTQALAGGSWTSDNGVYFYVNASGALRMWQANGTTSGSVVLGTLTAATDYLIVITADMAGSTNNVTSYINSTTGTSFNFTAETATTDEANGFYLCATSDAGTVRGILSSSGWRIRSYGFATQRASAGEVASIYTLYEARHGIDYTP